MSGGEQNYEIAVLSRALDLLDALSAADEPLGATEIAREIGATKSATFPASMTPISSAIPIASAETRVADNSASAGVKPTRTNSCKS